jgi:hypothetical protein
MRSGDLHRTTHVCYGTTADGAPRDAVYRLLRRSLLSARHTVSRYTSKCSFI